MAFGSSKTMDFIYLAIILVQIIYTTEIEASFCVTDIKRKFFQKLLLGNGTLINQENLAFELLPVRIRPEDDIRLAGYPSETHLVTTEDGYILTVFRIPGSKGSTPVFMMHGLEESAADWLASGKGRSLAYILHDEGYDVWLGNTRGNLFSKRHVKLTTNDPRFWNFSHTEMGIYDLPAVINYITDLSGKQLFYIGHSLAGSLITIMGIERPDVAQKVKANIGLAPGPFILTKSLPLLILMPVWQEFYDITRALDIYEFLPHGEEWDLFANYICGSKRFRKICSLVTFILAGFSPEHLDYSALQKFWTRFPGGTSVKVFVHSLQNYHRQTKFHKFSYGEEMNLKIYNSTLPPAYDLSKMRIPTAMFWAENDIIVPAGPIQEAYSQFPVKLGIHQVPDKTFNHFDYFIAKDAPERVYSKVLKIMSDVEKNSN